MERSEDRRALTFEALERRLSVRRRAQLDAARNEPRSDASEPGAAEREISAAVAAARARVAAERAATAAKGEAALARCGVNDGALETALAQARLSLRLAEGRAMAAFASARNEALRAKEDVEAFRRAHGLRRGALYPASPVLALATLALIAVFEAMFSATLFDRDVEGGLLAAAAIAGGLGAANVTLGFLGGFLGLRYLQHRSAPLKAAGGCAFALTLLLAIGLNVYAAQWRDAAHRATVDRVEAREALAAGAKLAECEARVAQNDRAAASDEVWAAELAKCRAKHPTPAAVAAAPTFFAFAAPEAVVLLMLGAGVWAFAALKGFSGVDDPYPDYGKLDRAARDAEDSLIAVRETLRDELEAPVEEARAVAAEQAEARREALAEAEALFDAAAERLAALNAEDRRLVEVEAALLDLYRRENARRRTAPPPAHFGAHLEPSGADPLGDLLAAPGAALQAARAAARNADAALSAGLAALAADLEAVSRRLEGQA